MKKKTQHLKSFPDGSDGKPPAMWRPGFDPWVGKIPWRRAWKSTPVFLPGESHGQKNLAGYTPRGHKELDMPEQLAHTHTVVAPIKLIRIIKVASNNFP